jgi:hypothetical protein
MCRLNKMVKSGDSTLNWIHSETLPGVLQMFRLILIIWSFIVCTTGFCNIGLAVSKGAQSVIISIPGLSFMELDEDEIRRLPQLDRLRQHAAWGAMNIRTPGKGMKDVYVSWGAGAPAEAGANAQAFSFRERIDGGIASDLYVRFNGIQGSVEPAQSQMIAANGLLIPNIGALRRLNEQSRYRATPGLLGTVLQKNGISAAVWGNADTRAIFGGDVPSMQRYAALTLMDRRGTLPLGETGSATLMPDLARPFGVKTDYSFLIKQWEMHPSSVTLFELGDLDRLYADKKSYALERFEALKHKILLEMDTFIGNVAARLGEEGELWIVSPGVHADAVRHKQRLAPVIRYQQGQPAGLLTSQTTRRQGIVSYVDMAPAILAYFGVSIPEGMVGFPIKAEVRPDAYGWLLKEIRDLREIYAWRPPVLYGVAVFEVAVLLLALVMAVRPVIRGRRIIRSLLFAMLLIPSALLWMGWFPNPGLAVVLTGTVIFVLAGACLFARLKGQSLIAGMAWAGILTSALLLGDGLFGEEAMQHSLLGYDVMIGARYYGMGNECMGVLLGSALLGLASALQSRAEAAAAGVGSPPQPHRPGPAPVTMRRQCPASPGRAAVLAAAFGTLVAGYLASPALGTNAGGAIAASVAFGVLAVRLRGGGAAPALRWGRLVLALAVFVLAAFAALWLLNAALPRLPAQQSHIGRAFDQLAAGRLDVIGALIRRKLEMNVRLIVVSAWSKVLITAVFVMAVMLLKPRGLFRSWQTRYPFLMHGFAACTIGAVAALAFNDSGIVAAATMIVYVAVPMLLLRLDETDE